MINLSDTRVILVHNESCKFDCGHCYYKFRDHRTHQDIDMLYEFVSSTNIPLVAIGFNPGNHIEEWCILLELLRESDMVVTVSIDWPLISDILGEMRGDSTICITYNPDIKLSLEVMGELEVMSELRSTNCNKVLNITDNYIKDKLPESFSILVQEVDLVYLLMTKGPVGEWKMTNERIDEYISKLELLKSVTTTPIKVDECVYGVMIEGIGNCKGDWLEVNSYGEVRTCPYSIQPDTVHRYGIDISNVEFPTICKCRNSNYQGV